jgi:phenylacetate-CoA ligase
MNDPLTTLRSAFPEIVWPVMPTPAGASILAMQYQLQQSQWYPPEQLHAQQFRQLDVLLRHAYDTTGHYRRQFDEAGFDPKLTLNEQTFTHLPLLARTQLQQSFSDLCSQRVPASSGRTTENMTSGSTGMPVRFLTSELTAFYWRVFTLRDHLWHRRDFSGKLAAIRLKVKEGEWPGWGPSVDTVIRSGPSATLDINRDVDEQLRWLEKQNPVYLLTFATNLEALAQRSLDLGVRLPALREARTISEMLPPGLHALVRKAWGVPLADLYSSQEIGYIALQCPEHEHYHVQSENVLVELLHDDGAPCAPGEVGRVVLTSLHNFAMPLIRYEIGDYAEAGAPCPCGRGLPVIRRIMGRVRNMVRLPDGGRHWPSLGMLSAMPEGLIKQFQCVQRSLQHIEVRLVAARHLTNEEEAKLRAGMQEKLGHPFDFNIVYSERLERGSGGKFEEFRCEMADA